MLRQAVEPHGYLVHQCRFIRENAHRFVNLANHLIIKKGAPGETKGGLIVLPFNFIGNIKWLNGFLDAIAVSGQGISISQFSTSEHTTPVRSNYCLSCGFELRYEHNPFGCVFWRKAGFSNCAYHFTYLDYLMPLREYQCKTQFISNTWHIYHYRPVSMDRSIFTQERRL